MAQRIGNALAKAAGHIVAGVILFGWLGGSMYGQGTYFVDCSGTNVNAFPSIGAALGVAGPNSMVLVTGTCNENVYIYNAMNLSLGALAGQTATLNGGMNVIGSSNVFL